MNADRGERSTLPASPSPQPALRPSSPPSTSIAVLAANISARITADADVTGVELRAQSIEPGDLFAALPGANAHGAEFASVAADRGATAVFTDDAGAALLADTELPLLIHPEPRAVLGRVSAAIYGNPSEKMTVVGITGTSGKTTTSYLLDAALRSGGRKTGLIGTIETRIAGHRVPSALTTPEAPQLHAMFAAMLEQGVDAVVMEVSSHALALGRVDGTRFAVGAFTNLSQDHLDFHRTFDEYFDAKARLFAPDSPVRARRAVVCVDDEWGRRMARIAGTAATVATSGPADWTVTDVTGAVSGSQSFVVHWATGRVRAAVRMPGAYNVANALVAIATAAECGVAPKYAIRGIAAVDVPGRVLPLAKVSA